MSKRARHAGNAYRLLGDARRLRPGPRGRVECEQVRGVPAEGTGIRVSVQRAFGECALVRYARRICRGACQSGTTTIRSWRAPTRAHAQTRTRPHTTAHNAAARHSKITSKVTSNHFNSTQIQRIILARAHPSDAVFPPNTTTLEPCRTALKLLRGAKGTPCARGAGAPTRDRSRERVGTAACGACHDRARKSHHIISHQIKSTQIKSNQTEPNQIKSKQCAHARALHLGDDHDRAVSSKTHTSPSSPVES